MKNSIEWKMRHEITMNLADAHRANRVMKTYSEYPTVQSYYRGKRDAYRWAACGLAGLLNINIVVRHQY